MAYNGDEGYFYGGGDYHPSSDDTQVIHYPEINNNYSSGSYSGNSGYYNGGANYSESSSNSRYYNGGRKTPSMSDGVALFLKIAVAIASLMIIGLVLKSCSTDDTPVPTPTVTKTITETPESRPSSDSNTTSGDDSVTSPEDQAKKIGEGAKQGLDEASKLGKSFINGFSNGGTK